MLVSVINSETSNISSILAALEKLKINYEVINKYKNSKKYSHFILPGVGSFGHAMRNLKKNNLDKFLREAHTNKKKILGICLGMQLLFEGSSEDDEVKGFGFIKGKFKKFGSKLKSPHIGFNYVYHDNKGIWKNIKNPSPFYFVHSYRLKKINSKNVKYFYTNYGEKFVSYINYENIYGAQFHPEKSHNIGLKFLNNFLYEV